MAFVSIRGVYRCFRVQPVVPVDAHRQPLPGLTTFRGAKTAAPADVPEPACQSARYFAFTLDVMDEITPDAILNWSLRFLIPCRRAIQSKSV